MKPTTYVITVSQDCVALELTKFPTQHNCE